MTKYLSTIEIPSSIVTPIDSAVRFPEILEQSYARYEADIAFFHELIRTSTSSAELLDRIRSPKVHKDTRMSLLKMFRRCVAPVIDTEMSKKITKVTTKELVNSYGATFKPIEKLQEQFSNLRPGDFETLAALVGEYDTRGQSGYALTEQFFDWFEAEMPDELSITGPRRAGRDVELSSVFADFVGGYPCDFVIRAGDDVLAVGFARYDATRGGAQSDDRTGGNWAKVEKARQYCQNTGRSFRIIFLSDGPGLTHNDTWREACDIDGEWDGRVRVTTLKLAPTRVTLRWLYGWPETSAEKSEVGEVIDLLAKASE
ncbi:hypothetical protein [Novosphingobium sediminicola]|uniref:BstEII n=1 Tax=Novosphingobium sediminicola TaxID=563162 RepID=A0A7W6G734_9SPHN|nr:hypothetical protein [Novosphingobium sediminicola]MBB3955946.1 hypothetical protein [Novosphingobium sediminicola]